MFHVLSWLSAFQTVNWIQLETNFSFINQIKIICNSESWTWIAESSSLSIYLTEQRAGDNRGS